MDGHLIHSLMGTNVPTEKKEKRTEGDGDAFSKALEDATGKSSTSGKAGQAMIDDKSDKASEKKEDKKKQAKAEQEEYLKASGQKLDKGTPAYLRKLMQTNVDTLSMADKQAMRLAEFSNEGQAKAAQQKLQQQPMAQQNFNQQVTGVSTPQAGKASGRGDSDAASEHTPTRDSQPKDSAAFEKALTAQSPAEKGTVNLEKLLARESKATEEVSKTTQAEKNHDRQVVIDQILSQIEVRNLANKTELHLRLNPEYLGELKMNLVHTEEGVRADISTTSKSTRALLLEGEDDLREQAKNKGVRLGKVNIKLVDDMDAA